MRTTSVETDEIGRTMKSKRMKPFLAPAEVLTELERAGEVREASAGTVLFRRGQPNMGLFVVLTGRVALSSGEDPIRIVRIAEHGCLLGLPATVSGSPYSLTAEVVLDSRLCFVNRKQFRRVLVDNPQVGFAVLKMLADEVSDLRQLAVYKC